MVYVCLHVGIQSGTRFQVSSGNCYVGSTMQSIFQRRNTRIRKFNQLQASKLVKCELAIRYWQACNNFYAYVMIPWKHFTKSSQLHVNEVLLIDQIQPSFNYPFVSRLIFAAGKAGSDTNMWALLRSQGANSDSCHMSDLILISHAMSRL